MANIPEYMRVRQYVVDLVMSHPDSDERIMSERELCRKLNVARTTARRAFKSLVDDDWIYVKRGKGMFINAEKYRNNPASIRKFYKIMIVWDDGKNVYIEGFQMNIMEQFCATLKRKPVLLQTINIISQNGQILNELKMYNPDGIIWLRPPTKMNSVIAAMRQKITVCVLGKLAGKDEFAVSLDYYAAGRLAANWFLEQKCKRPVFVCQKSESDIQAALLQGWLDEFTESKVTFDNNLIISANANKNIINELKSVLDDGIDGVFSFGSEFSAVDIAMIELDIQCPVLIDENYYGDYGCKTKVSAKLLLFPPEIATTAAKEMFRRLSEPDYVPSKDEIIFKATIKQLEIISKEFN